MFIITNGKKAVEINRKGTAALTEMQYAESFTYEKASKIMKQLPRPLQNLNLEILDIVELESCKIEQSEIDDIVSHLEPSPDVSDVEESSHILSTQPLGEILLELEQVLSVTQEALQNRVNESYVYRLKDELKILELKEEDLLHEIELEDDKHARDGYKLYKELRELRRERRRIKDEILIFGLLSSQKVVRDIDTVLKSISGLKVRRYRRRVIDN